MRILKVGKWATVSIVRSPRAGRDPRRGLSRGARVVDMRSDTVTQPCAAMRAAMAGACVGDDVYGEDPTVKELQRRAAALLGKEDAVLLPSSTMANLACILTLTTRGDQVLLGRQSHLYNWEQGNVSSLAGCVMAPLDTLPDGTFDVEALCQAVSYDDPHVPRARLVCLENSHGGRAGTAVPAAFADEVGLLCARRELVMHIDGARILNAAVALQVAPDELARAATTVTMCLSKGIGAPVGSLAAGSAEHMHGVRRWRKALGGGMRQAGNPP
jgi:threonine aldolase